MDRRGLIFGLSALATPVVAQSPPWQTRLVAAAESQVGKTLSYDPAYTRLAYPNGDVPLSRGVCTDVVIRAYRTAFSLDLQTLVHEDMTANFARYPKLWGLKRPDRNIDHRRVPNLETFLKRRGASQALPPAPATLQAGDLVTQRLPGNLPHILVVHHRRQSGRPLAVHNIGQGARVEDALFDHPIVGWFRFAPPARG
ncbi:MAG: DUF1287 domain-containing protein [Caulobacteraceae bacterium]|nr:DUF1287 domain-containing protein [Caulobacteraceae bacterium]